MKVAAVQVDIVWRDPSENMARLTTIVDQAAAAGAEFVVLPEMFPTGYSIDAAAIAEATDGTTITALIELAASRRVWIGGSLAVRDGVGELARNRFVLVGPDRELHTYDKRHPFSFAREHEQFAAGDTLVTVEIGGLRVTPFVCYDLRFADDFWERGPGTDLFVVVANWPSARRHHWTTLLRARAIENQCFVVGVNRVGTADGLEYSGDTCVIDPLGETLASATEVETTLMVEVSRERVEEVRSRFRFLDDRRSAGSLPVGGIAQ